MSVIYHVSEAFSRRVIEQDELTLPAGEYHGAGCTPSASLAALRAVGLGFMESSVDAENYC